MNPPRHACIHCGRDHTEVPLISLRYQDKDLWICPQHLPILIHKPAQLAHKLPGLELLGPAEHAHD